jgi:tetratricopeptide (TPR) repeat protein
MDLALAEVDGQYAMGEKIGDHGQMSVDLGTKASILRETGKYDEALETQKKAVMMIETEDNPEGVKEGFRREYHSAAARILALKKEFAKAEAEADAYRVDMVALKDPTSIKAAHAVAGMIALEEKKFDKALVELRQADQEDVVVLYRMALAYMGQGDQTKAKELLTKVVHWNPELSLEYAFVRPKAVKILGTIVVTDDKRL